MRGKSAFGIYQESWYLIVPRACFVIATGNVVMAAVLKQHPERRIESKFLIKESPAAIGVRHQEPELLNWVNVFVFHKKLSGDLDRLSRQWFGEPLRPLPVL